MRGWGEESRFGFHREEAIQFRPASDGRIWLPGVACDRPVVERADRGVRRVRTQFVQPEVLSGFGGGQQIGKDAGRRPILGATSASLEANALMVLAGIEFSSDDGRMAGKDDFDAVTI